MNIASLHASHLFHENYTLINEIGTGTHSTVYTAKNSQGELVAVKKYAVRDQDAIEILEQNGSSVNTFISQLAQKELKIGQLTDHPNIVKIKEVFLEDSTAYIVMDYIEGETLNNNYSFEVRIALMQQLLSAIEHLTLRNVIIDDLRSQNVLISHQHLTLLDLGGNEILFQDADMLFGHYLEMIESTLQHLGGDAVLEKCKHLLPPSVREETISPAHVKVLVTWIEALQKELSTSLQVNNTFCESSAEQVLAAHTQLQAQYPDHISFNTAQHSKFLAYSLIAAQVLKKFSPGKYTDAYLQNTHFLRYNSGPKSLEELFRQYPVRPDYDTAYSQVGSALISVSPSLKETESQESAWAIFEKNDRESYFVSDHINAIFESENISPHHYRDRIEQIVEETPPSNEGLIYNFFIPKNAPLHKAVYLSEGYGIPIGDPHSETQLRDFFERYTSGLVEEKNTQLRFLPSAVIPDIKSYRFTTIPREQLNAYSKKVEEVVHAIFADHLNEMLELAAFAFEVEKESNQRGYHQLCYRHLCRRDVQLAQYYWHKIEGEHKFTLLPAIIACLLNKNRFIQAYNYFQQYEEQLIHKDQLIAQFAFLFIEQDNRPMLDLMVKKLTEPRVKKFVLELASSHYPEYAQENIPGEIENLMSYDELLELGKQTNY